jgi:hypothetical protein
MKWKQVKRIAYNANCTKSLVLRQQFAIAMIKLMQSKKRLCCLDESWINDSQFTRKKWKLPGTTNSISGHQVNPRITAIGCLDTLGNVYMSLLQSNTNNTTMKMFLTSLVKRLELEDRDYSTNVVGFMDGAGYHMSDDVILHLKKLRLNVIFTGPRSYDGSPIERFWAYLKMGDLNKMNMATGRK